MSAEKGFKLRSDLVIEPVEENGTPYYGIKDPRRERFYRIKPLEYYLISQFDGNSMAVTPASRTSDPHHLVT